METIKTMHGTVHVCQAQAELGKAGAKYFIEVGNKCIKERGMFTVGLSGGHTPPVLYENLTSKEMKDQIDWKKVHFFVSDERCVPHDSKESNWGMAEKLLFAKIRVPDENLHSLFDQDVNPRQSAEDYEKLIRQFFEVGAGDIPSFDLIQLGMGPDGHTASLFPGSRALTEDKKLVTENFVDKFETQRITFTFPLLNHARHILFLVEGAEKSHVFAEAVNAERAIYPVQHIRPESGDVTWYVDQDTARDLMARKV